MVKTDNFSYSDSQTRFVGSISIESSGKGPRPGILVLPTFKGLTDFERGKADALAELGYVALAVDMYGDGRSSNDPDEARAMMNELNGDRRLLLRRIEAALVALRSHEFVDQHRMAAIGFCFGGKCVLDLARSGADLRAAVSFHGVYDPPPFESVADWKASVLVLHGWDDPLNAPAQTVTLAEELTRRNADWQIIAYGSTGHGFTNPAANSPENGLMYNELTDRRSWQAMQDFLDEILA